MNLLPIEKIIVREGRQRKEHDESAHQELVTSLTETSVGLQHPLVLRREGDEFVLLSGERRLRAIKDAYSLGIPLRHLGLEVEVGMVPYVLTEALSELDAEEAELEENIRRKDLTWAEKASATAKLLALRQKQAALSGERPPTIADISAEVRGSAAGYHHDQTKREVIVSRYLDDPDVQKAATLDDAIKVLKKKERDTRAKELAAATGADGSFGLHKVFNVNCLEWMKNAAPEQFDVIVSDPPYGMGADEFGDSGGKADGAHFYDDSLEMWEGLMGPVALQLFRLAKLNAHAYLFCDFENFGQLKGFMTLAGWKVFRTPLVWHKPTGSRTPWVNKGPQRRYECILYATKGEREVNCLRGDVLEHTPDKNIGHPAQKPVALYRDLLERSALPGDKVFDPFCGSGPIFPAASALKLLATGLELDSRAYGLSVQRLKETL